MSVSTIKGVKIQGVVSCVPPKRVDNLECELLGSAQDAEKFVKATGIRYRRVVEKDVCTSDLCEIAANDLLKGLAWNPDGISVIITVTQTPDYLAPNTAIILQHRLGLPKTALAFDIPLGCSGYIYGLSVIASLLKSLNLGKGLLLVGDTLSRQASPFDKSTYPLFGDAATATAIELTNNPEDNIDFLMGSDGEGYKSIIVPGGGYREPFTAESLQYKDFGEGISRTSANTIMEGTDVFSFGISVVPSEVNRFFKNFGYTTDDFEYAFFHQANKFMNEKIRKKIGFKEEQAPYSLVEYGNTSSATIPLTISYQYGDQGASSTGKKIFCCGFGVGLSWGICTFNTSNMYIPKIIEG